MPRYHGQCRPVNPEPGTSVSRFGVAEPVNGTRLGPIAAAFVAKRTSVRVVGGVGHGPSDLSQDADRENAGDSSVAVVRFANLAAGYVFLMPSRSVVCAITSGGVFVSSNWPNEPANWDMIK